MAKRYTRVNFQNRPSVATPLNDVNLNILDKGIDDLDNAIVDLENAIGNLENANTNILTSLADINNNIKYTLADTTKGLNKIYTTGTLGVKIVSYSAGDVGAPSAYWGICLCKGSASANAQIAIDSTGAVYERMYTSGSPNWNRILRNIDLANTDTVNDSNKPLGANVGYSLGQEIDVINGKISGSSLVTDLNTVVTAGIYSVYVGATNTPVDAYGILTVKTADYGHWVFQEFITTAGVKYSRRNINSTGWSPWA